MKEILLFNLISIDYNNLCGNSSINSVIALVGYFIQIIYWIVPIVIIILGMTDYAKAIISNDEKSLTKATSTLVRRIVSGIVIFMVPTLISTFSSILLKYDITNNQFMICTNCLLNPDECRENIKK